MLSRALRAIVDARAPLRPVGLLVFAAALIAPAAVFAYQLNPLKDRDRGGDLAGVGRSVDTVHEDITHAAIACATSAASADPAGAVPICRESVRARTSRDPGNIFNPLIVGVWWNDDPRHFLHDNQIVSAALQWSDAQHSARQMRRFNGGYAHPHMRRLLYRSHFGDLQFLHAMAGRSTETAGETQHRIIRWFAFAYGVATGAVAQDLKLSQLAPPLSGAFADERGWTVERLFKPRASMSELPLSELALGSMLHVAQDSYSSSHTARDMAPTQACRQGRITEFHSFLHQDTEQHREQDSRAALHHSTAMSFTALQNPVEASARLILLVRRRADWSSVVEPYLRSTLFCLDPSAQAHHSAAASVTVRRRI